MKSDFELHLSVVVLPVLGLENTYATCLEELSTELETGIYIIDALLKEPSVGLFDEQIKLGLELSIEVVLRLLAYIFPST